MSILVIAEHDNASLKSATLHAVTAARKLGFGPSTDRHNLATDLFRPPAPPPATPQLSLDF